MTRDPSGTDKVHARGCNWGEQRVSYDKGFLWGGGGGGGGEPHEPLESFKMVKKGTLWTLGDKHITATLTRGAL